MKTKVKASRSLAVVLAACLVAPTTLWAQTAVDENPSPWAMAGDLVVARPIGVVLTAAGTAAWVVSLPFTLLGGNAGEAAETLVIGPAEATFVRCLGCRNAGYSGKDTSDKSPAE
jgi:hypothetical protein